MVRWLSVTIERIDLADLLLIAEAATGVPAQQLKHDVDYALAEAALAAPYSGIADREFFRTAVEKIGVLGYRLARYHPFTDGNKRTARVARRELALRYGLTWADRDEDDAVETMVQVASGMLAEEQFISWVADRVA
jgi:prophage maintenance system killer protein